MQAGAGYFAALLLPDLLEVQCTQAMCAWPCILPTGTWQVGVGCGASLPALPLQALWSAGGWCGACCCKCHGAAALCKQRQRSMHRHETLEGRARCLYSIHVFSHTCELGCPITASLTQGHGRKRISKVHVRGGAACAAAVAVLAVRLGGVEGIRVRR